VKDSFEQISARDCATITVQSLTHETVRRWVWLRFDLASIKKKTVSNVLVWGLNIPRSVAMRFRWGYYESTAMQSR